MRGKGFGSTMFHYLLQEAKELNVAQCVQASPDGVTIYKSWFSICWTNDCI